MSAANCARHSPSQQPPDEAVCTCAVTWRPLQMLPNRTVPDNITVGDIKRYMDWREQPTDDVCPPEVRARVEAYVGKQLIICPALKYEADACPANDPID